MLGPDEVTEVTVHETDVNIREEYDNDNCKSDEGSSNDD